MTKVIGRMVATTDLIERLVARACPVRRMRPPVARAAAWLLLAALVLVLVGTAQGVRPDIAERARLATFVIGMAAALVTGILAAVAAFMVSLPERPLIWVALPVPALLVWVTTIGYGCLTDWVAIGPDGLRPGDALRCFLTLAATSLPLSLGMLIMIPHAALFRATAVATLGGLAVSGIAATALSIFHDLDAAVLVLITNFGTAGLLVTSASVFGRRMLFSFAPRQLVR